MKRVLILFIISLGLTGCRQKEGIKAALPKELMNREWFFYDETIGEHEIMRFKEDGTVICRPIGYDREGLYENGPFETYKTAEDISYAELSITSYMSVQDDYEYEERYDVNYSELDLQKAQETTESGAAIAFLWFDDQMQVEKLVFFSQLSISESVEVEDF